jgi:hypothetical protein
VDAFRLVRFGGRWRFVYIDVSGPEVSASDRGAGLR